MEDVRVLIELAQSQWRHLLSMLMNLTLV